jgi:DNA-binding NarL/FixJ family response regulator
VDTATREQVMARYRVRAAYFDAVAERRGTTAEPTAAAPPLSLVPTERELEILQLVAVGETNVEIGQRLHITEETVKTHVQHLLRRLSARNRAHAVAIGWRQGFLA